MKSLKAHRAAMKRLQAEEFYIHQEPRPDEYRTAWVVFIACTIVGSLVWMAVKL